MHVTKELNNFLTFRASTSDRQRAEALKSLMQLGSMSAVVRQLMEEKAKALGIE